MVGQDETVAELLERVVEREPLRDPVSRGYSGAPLERVRLDDGRRLIVKRISPRWDVLMRITHDDGRAGRLWAEGVFDRFPPAIEHATIAAEPDPETSGWTIIMRDLSSALLPDDRMLTRGECRRILSAAAALHDTFMGKWIDGLCSLRDYLTVFAPDTVAREAGDLADLAPAIQRGWELFFDGAVANEIAEAVGAVHDQPNGLATELARDGTTLIHGDLWLANLGLLPDRVVMLDWGLATQGPPELEFTMFLTGSWSRIAATREQIVDDFRASRSERHDERTLRLAFLTTFANFGWNKALDAVEHPDPAIRAQEQADLSWWVERVREALAIWSPV